jgi:hypothetical protein
VTLEELDVRRFRMSGIGAGQGEHFPDHVQPIGLAGRADPAGRQQHIKTA